MISPVKGLDRPQVELATLERYLTGDYFRDRRGVEEVEYLLKQVGETIVACYRADDARGDNAWPYEVRRDCGLGKNPFSVSTTSMILLATMRLLGKATRIKRADSALSNSFPLTLPKHLTKELEDVATRASARLTAEVLKGDVVTTSSATYGQNDPFSRAWLVELANCDWPKDIEQQKKWEAIGKLTTEMAEDSRSKDPADSTSYFTDLLQQTLDNAFVPLRVVHSLCYGSETRDYIVTLKQGYMINSLTVASLTADLILLNLLLS
jgi:hypothetical protein